MTPKELAEEGLRQQVVEALLDYYGTNNVHPDDQSDVDDLYDVVVGVIGARDKARAEEFRRLAAEAKATNTRTADDCYAGQKAGEAITWEQAAQMLEEKLNGDGLK